MRAVIDDTFEDSVHHSEAKNLLDSLDEWILPTIVIHEYVGYEIPEHRCHEHP